MQYACNAYDAHDVLWNGVPLFGGGGVLTVGYPAYAVVPPGFALVPHGTTPVLVFGISPTIPSDLPHTMEIQASSHNGYVALQT